MFLRIPSRTGESIFSVSAICQVLKNTAAFQNKHREL